MQLKIWSENMSSTKRSKEMPSTNRSKKMWSDDIQQIVNLFHNRLHFGEVIKDPVDYLEALKPELRAAGPELEFLQLAVPDKKSPFGWRPTALLMEYIAEGNTTKPLYEVDIFWELLADSVFGYKARRKEEGSVFTSELLEAVGLLHGEDWSDLWVTEALHNLFHNGYCMSSEHFGRLAWQFKRVSGSSGFKVQAAIAC
jgi:hypothetical protein